MALSQAECARFAPHLRLPGFAPAMQAFVRAARVRVVGAGEVAAPAILYLATSGVGTLLLDDAFDLAPADSASWLFRLGRLGEPRILAGIAAVRTATSFCKPRPYATGTDPTAVLVCASSPALAREGAEKARIAGLPHVVALADGDDGEVVCVRAGAPCYACASRLARGVPAPPGPAAGALGALAALELLQLLAGVAEGPAGRRVELVRGQLDVAATTRVAGCACARPRPS